MKCSLKVRQRAWFSWVFRSAQPSHQFFLKRASKCVGLCFARLTTELLLRHNIQSSPHFLGRDLMVHSRFDPKRGSSIQRVLSLVRQEMSALTTVFRVELPPQLDPALILCVLGPQTLMTYGLTVQQTHRRFVSLYLKLGPDQPSIVN